MLARVLINNRLLLTTVFALARPVTPEPAAPMLTAVAPFALAFLIALVTSLN